MPLPVRILLRALLNIALVWFMATHLDQYLFVTGGWRAYLIIGSLLTLMNLLVRPLLDIATLPLKLFAKILSMIIVNGLFIWLTATIAGSMDPKLVTMTIQGGAWGWIVVTVMIGIWNWLQKVLLHRKTDNTPTL